MTKDPSSRRADTVADLEGFLENSNNLEAPKDNETIVTSSEQEDVIFFFIVRVPIEMITSILIKKLHYMNYL